MASSLDSSFNFVTNGDIIRKLESDGKQSVLSSLRQLSHGPCTDKALGSVIDRCVKKRTQLMKSTSRVSGQNAYTQWLDQKITMPQAKSVASDSVPVTTKQDPILCTCPASTVAGKLVLELNAVEENLQETKQNLKLKTKEVLHLRRSRTLASELTKAKKTNKQLTAEISGLKRRNTTKVKVIKKIRIQNTRLQQELLDRDSKKIATTAEITNLKEELKVTEELLSATDDFLETTRGQLNDSIATQDWLKDLADDNKVVTCFDEMERRYSAETRECIYELLQLNVPSRSVCPVIQSVMKLAGKTPDRLPGKTTILEMNIERLVLAQKQLAEELPSKENTTLYTDETSKFGVKYSGYHASDEDGRLYVLGMRNLVTKSSNDTLSGLKDILDDIERRSEAQDDMTSKKILVGISATMSDRAATEVKFNNLLQDLRQDVLPQVRENWDELSAADQLAASQLLNFFCGLHSLVHFAEAASLSLAELDRGMFDQNPPIFDKSFYKVKESGTARLVRTASNALARGGDEKSGRYGDFKTFIAAQLREKGLHSLPLEPYHGNRFNILFENSVAFFFLHKEVQEYLQSNQTNGLLKAVLHDLNVEHYLAGAKALGLVSRFVTGPLWSLLEAKDVHIFQMNDFYLLLVEKLEYATVHLEDFMHGDILVFEEATVLKADVMMDALLEPWEHDEKVKVCLSVILPALAIVTKKLFKDHLPGGRWENVTDEMKEKCRGTQKHNKFAESVFGYLDHMLRKSPNITALSAEAYLMFLSNRTLEWLQSKTDEDRKKLIEDARKQAPSTKKTFKEREAEIKRRHLIALEEAARKHEQQKRQRLITLEKYTSTIVYYGLWQSESQVDETLITLPTIKEKKDALKAQLNFRQHVLKQEKKSITKFTNVFAFSKKVDQKTVECGVEELAGKVKALIRHSFTIPTAPPPGNVPVLVGKRVLHKFHEGGEDGRPGMSYQGKVISQVPGYPAWYNLIYDCEGEDPAVYTYRLLDDWKQGNLQLLI